LHRQFPSRNADRCEIYRFAWVWAVTLPLVPAQKSLAA
jgi:hypothetical protein